MTAPDHSTAKRHAFPAGTADHFRSRTGDRPGRASGVTARTPVSGPGAGSRRGNAAESRFG